VRVLKIVAFQGERGAYSELAAGKYFGSKIQVSPSLTFDSGFTKVKNGSCDAGIVPIENSLFGSVSENYDLLAAHSLYICGEVNLQINHFFLSHENYKLSEIQKVYSHPQAIGQCSQFLKKLKAQIIPVYDTAGAAKMIAENGEPFSAAIAGEPAAKAYGMKILKKHIQNNKKNYTRFLIICKKRNDKKLKNPKTSICFELKDAPGALFKALSVFALRDIDLTKIESRPIPSRTFEYRFYAALKGSLNDEKVKNALNHLKEISISVKELGSYEMASLDD
jgi:prephenate dehydratase